MRVISDILEFTRMERAVHRLNPKWWKYQKKVIGISSNIKLPPHKVRKLSKIRVIFENQNSQNACLNPQVGAYYLVGTQNFWVNRISTLHCIFWKFFILNSSPLEKHNVKDTRKIFSWRKDVRKYRPFCVLGNHLKVSVSQKGKCLKLQLSLTKLN